MKLHLNKNKVTDRSSTGNIKDLKSCDWMAANIFTKWCYIIFCQCWQNLNCTFVKKNYCKHVLVYVNNTTEQVLSLILNTESKMDSPLFTSQKRHPNSYLAPVRKLRTHVFSGHSDTHSTHQLPPTQYAFMCQRAHFRVVDHSLIRPYNLAFGFTLTVSGLNPQPKQQLMWPTSISYIRTQTHTDTHTRKHVPAYCC